jgi:hypothetical protein
LVVKNIVPIRQLPDMLPSLGGQNVQT